MSKIEQKFIYKSEAICMGIDPKNIVSIHVKIVLNKCLCGNNPTLTGNTDKKDFITKYRKYVKERKPAEE